MIRFICTDAGGSVDEKDKGICSRCGRGFEFKPIKQPPKQPRRRIFCPKCTEQFKEWLTEKRIETRHLDSFPSFQRKTRLHGKYMQWEPTWQEMEGDE